MFHAQFFLLKLLVFHFSYEVYSIFYGAFFGLPQFINIYLCKGTKIVLNLYFLEKHFAIPMKNITKT
ncbi:hypothetical protein HQ49_07065 [Porphyromonas gulae]|nr:hypothetical protein HQ49_07065 [Porphyromonas gulae]